MGNCFNLEPDEPPQEDLVSVLRAEEARGKPFSPLCRMLGGKDKRRLRYVGKKRLDWN